MNCQLCNSEFDYQLTTITDKRDAQPRQACELCAGDWAMTTQDRIAHFFLGWRLDTTGGKSYWLIPSERDTSPSPGQQAGVAVRLPNLDTFEGVAVWCALIKAVLEPLGDIGINWTQASGYYVALWLSTGVTRRLADGMGATELAALEAAVLKLMEAE